MSSPLSAVIIGAGHRSMAYASYSLKHPDELRVVAVAEPDAVRREGAARRFAIPPERQYLTADELASEPRLADVAINGTMDLLHVPTTLPLLEAGYHVLLEKPIAPSAAEMLELAAAVRRTGRRLMVCHGLRYAPFYVAVRERIAGGEIGDLIHIHTSENVSYHHMAVAFVRGKWRRADQSNPMILAKCCHDLDLVAWFQSGVAPLRVSSFGSRSFFRPERAPEGAGSRCLSDCAIEPDCVYSARKHYIDQNLWGTYAWEPIESLGDHTVADRLASLATDNPYGRCVWACDNDVVDRQSVVIEFADGCVASHDMVGGVSRPCRRLHIIGTAGEIEGVMEEGRFVVRHPDPRAGHEYSEEPVTADGGDEDHGGGDMRMVADFLRVVRGEQASLSTTDIGDSINGHLTAFAADESARTGEVIELGR